MKLSHGLLSMALIITSVTGYAQKTDRETGESKPSETSKANQDDDSNRTHGLRKIASASPDLDIDIHIDHEALESDIEIAVEHAMEAVKGALENLNIDLDPLDFQLPDLNIDIDPVDFHIPEIDIPEIDIDIEPVDVDFNHLDVDVDIDEDNFDWRDADDDTDEDIRNKAGNTSKEKDKESDHDRSDKSKGLKKLN